jgi:cathepsin L
MRHILILGLVAVASAAPLSAILPGILPVMITPEKATTPYCLHAEDLEDHKCFEACASATFKSKGYTVVGSCPTKYNTVDKTLTEEQCPDGVTNLRYCAATALNVTIKTKGEAGLKAPEWWTCRHNEDVTDNKCYQACTTQGSFEMKGLASKGGCPSKYNSVDNHKTDKVCNDGVTNPKYCKGDGKKVIHVVEKQMGVAGKTIVLADSEYKALWTQFKADHSKSYATTEEHDSRFSTFKDNVNFIELHNVRAAEHGFTVGLNQFADMTRHEFKQVMLTYQAERKTPNNVTLFDESTIADSVDWVAKGAVTPVKNQGQCGSCWAFSTTGSIEGAYQIATGKLLSFSEQELVDCAGSFGNQGCNGGLMDDGFKYIEANGDASESDYAYTGKTGTCSSSKKAKTAIAKGAVTSFSDVKTDSESQLLAAVTAGPVSVAIEADQSGFQFYKSGVFSGTCGTKLDHGVLVVGYGTDSGKDYWKVKNSWGSTWGLNGYILLERSSKTTGRKLLGGGGGSSGECGLLKQPSFPKVSSSLNGADDATCLHHEDIVDHKCFEACASATFKSKGYESAGSCPTKYNTVDKTVTEEQCPDGVTNLRYCAATALNVTIKTKGEA